VDVVVGLRSAQERPGGGPPAGSVVPVLHAQAPKIGARDCESPAANTSGSDVRQSCPRARRCRPAPRRATARYWADADPGTTRSHRDSAVLVPRRSTRPEPSNAPPNPRRSAPRPFRDGYPRAPARPLASTGPTARGALHRSLDADLAQGPETSEPMKPNPITTPAAPLETARMRSHPRRCGAGRRAASPGHRQRAIAPPWPPAAGRRHRSPPSTSTSFCLASSPSPHPELELDVLLGVVAGRLDQ